MSRSLPPRPDLEHLRKQARHLASAFRGGDTVICVRLRTALRRFASASDAEILAGTFGLRDAQHVVAREYGFATWAEPGSSEPAGVQQG